MEQSATLHFLFRQATSTCSGKGSGKFEKNSFGLECWNLVLAATMKTAYIFSQKQDDFYASVRGYLQSNGVWCGPMDKANFTVVLGGDGSVLGAGRQGVPNPVVVINTGHLGFLTSSAKENYRETLERFLQGSYTLTKRRTLRVQVAASPHGSTKRL